MSTTTESLFNRLPINNTPPQRGVDLSRHPIFDSEQHAKNYATYAEGFVREELAKADHDGTIWRADLGDFVNPLDNEMYRMGMMSMQIFPALGPLPEERRGYFAPGETYVAGYGGGRVVLSGEPHPDDRSVNPAVTSLRLAVRGNYVRGLLFTCGEWAGRATEGFGRETGYIRLMEAMQEAKILHTNELGVITMSKLQKNGSPCLKPDGSPDQYWGLPEWFLSDQNLSMKIAIQLARIQSPFTDKPFDMTLAPASQDSHPDHISVRQIIDKLGWGGNPAFYQQLRQGSNGGVQSLAYVTWPGAGNASYNYSTLYEQSGVEAQIKRDAISCHRGQGPNYPYWPGQKDNYQGGINFVDARQPPAAEMFAASMSGHDVSCEGLQARIESHYLSTVEKVREEVTTAWEKCKGD